MKAMLGFVVVALSWGCLSASAGSVREIDQPLVRAYVPPGYDNNDMVEIMVSGYFPSTCYHVGRASATDAGGEVAVHLSAYEFKGDCLKIPVPFFHVVRVGMVREPGRYRIRDRSSGRTIGSVDIARAGRLTHGTDEFPYAPLTDAFLLPHRDPYLVLQGAFTNSCLDFVSIDMDSYRDVMVVVPRVGFVRKENCRNGTFRFNKAYPIRKPLPRESFLLHVRSMAGRSINKMILSN